MEDGKGVRFNTQKSKSNVKVLSLLDIKKKAGQFTLYFPIFQIYSVNVISIYMIMLIIYRNCKPKMNRNFNSITMLQARLAVYFENFIRYFTDCSWHSTNKRFAHGFIDMAAVI